MRDRAGVSEAYRKKRRDSRREVGGDSLNSPHAYSSEKQGAASMEVRYGGRHRQTGSRSYSSSSSGTISSCESGYVFSSSHLSSTSMETVDIHLLNLELDVDMRSGFGIEIETETERKDTESVHVDPINKNRSETQEKEERMKRIKRLVQEFACDAPSADDEYMIGDVQVVRRWLTELGGGWILELCNSASAAVIVDNTIYARSWIRVLSEIRDTIRLVTPSFSGRRGSSMPSIREEEHETNQRGDQDSIPDQFQFTEFINATMLTLLDFVDVICSKVAISSGMPVPYVIEKLSILLAVRFALSEELSKIWFLFHSQTSAQVERTKQDEIIKLLSAKEAKLDKTVWVGMEYIRTHVLLSIGNLYIISLGQSSDIHKVTRSVMRYISFIQSHYSSMSQIVSEASSLGKYVPHVEDLFPLNSMIMQMTSFLQERLMNMSEAFPDQGLRFLFLLNNSYFIWEGLSHLYHSHLNHSSLKVYIAALNDKLNEYKESYLQISWAPLLKFLFNTKPVRFWKNYNPQITFESELRKTYITQRLWKVPNTELKKSLRNAITEIIKSGYTKYINDNNITTPRVTPQELEEMLQDLFEG